MTKASRLIHTTHRANTISALLSNFLLIALVARLGEWDRDQRVAG